MKQLAIILASALLALVAATTSGVVQAISGFILLLFVPGFVTLQALYPRGTNLRVIERLVLGIGMSIALASVTGMVLNYTGWGIRILPVLFALVVYITVICSITWFRRNNTGRADEFLEPQVSTEDLFPNASKAWRNIFLGVLVVANIGAISFLGYQVSQPVPRDAFTEFYVLDSSGTTESYPKEVLLGESVQIIVGIVNNEGIHATYHVRIVIGDDQLLRSDRVVLVDREKWEGLLTFVPLVHGSNQKLEILLYEGLDEEPAQDLSLRIDVRKE